MIDDSDNEAWAYYSSFSVGSLADLYKLTVGG